MSMSITKLESSNLPASQKSAIRRMYEKIGGSSAMGRVRSHAMATGHAVRQGGESLVVGGILGYAHQELKGGLDIDIQGKVKVPLDGVVAVAGLGASVFMAGEEIAPDLRNAGAAAAAILAFRKTSEFVAKKKGQPARIAGEFEFGHESGEDPIIEYARSGAL